MKIGFVAELLTKEKMSGEQTGGSDCPKPVKSLVEVHFPARNMTLPYFNDRFDLRCGDAVFVDGKLEGLRGQVVSVTYNFKIKLADYHRVIAVADTRVEGEFHTAGSHFVTFDREVIPYQKVLGWFKPPCGEDEEFAVGCDDNGVLLERFEDIGFSSAIAERGWNYYAENRVTYLCIDGTDGCAIVEGREPYEVEFTFRHNEIINLTCSCFCSYPCKHEFAAMVQLRDLLDRIERDYSSHFEESGYFAAITKGALFRFVIDNHETGSFRLG